ncbi:MAG: FKBP-type peptidyl-prolyl cis-trans isomerase, partial [Chlamydiae bacterium]|nr:FKBP-type peptidyl-prolyl cis-trans isomerase [Chlamydiota bacterium]
MKRFFLATLLALSFSLQAEESAFDQIDRGKIAETLGHLIVRHLVNPGFELDVERIIAGIQNEKEGMPSPLTEEEYEQAIYAIQEHMFNKDAAKNLSDANAFLEKNVENTGIETIDEQLQYRVEAEGSGEIVMEDSVPQIRYEGKLMDGTVFASCLEEEPISLPMQ